MDREIGTLTDALTLLDEYIEAYNELRADHARLIQRYLSTKTSLAHAHQAIQNDLCIEEARKPRESECPF